MKLFDPNRPKTLAGYPAILLDGSAIPPLILVPISTDQYTLNIYLNSQDPKTNLSYSLHTKPIDPKEASKLLLDYVEDPELFYQTHFNWVPQENKNPLTSLRANTFKIKSVKHGNGVTAIEKISIEDNELEF